MPFQMRFRMLFTLLLSLIVPAGSASADMCFNFENCYKVFQEGEIWRGFKNSIILVAITLIVEITCSALGAYGIARSSDDRRRKHLTDILSYYYAAVKGNYGNESDYVGDRMLEPVSDADVLAAG